MIDPSEVRAQQQSAQPEVQQTESYSCWDRNWPRFFLLGSLAVAVLTFVSIIFNFIKIVIKPNATLLNIYCLVFSLLALSAEMRQFRWFRKISYIWLKYMYFLTYYKPRGLFYILFGLLLLGNQTLLYISSVVAMVIGVMMIVVSFFCNLPVYEDPQERQREQEEARKYYESQGVSIKSLAAAFRGRDSAPSAKARDDVSAVMSDTTTNAQASRYEPPALPIREQNKVPPSTVGRSTPPASANSSPTGSPGVSSTARGAAMFAGPAGVGFGTQPASMDGDRGSTPETTAARQGAKAVGETQLRREFAAAMERDEPSLR